MGISRLWGQNTQTLSEKKPGHPNYDAFGQRRTGTIICGHQFVLQRGTGLVSTEIQQPQQSLQELPTTHFLLQLESKPEDEDMLIMPYQGGENFRLALYLLIIILVGFMPVYSGFLCNIQKLLPLVIPVTLSPNALMHF